MTLFEIFLAFFGIFLAIFSFFWLQKISFFLRFLALLSGISLIIFTIFPGFLKFFGRIFGLERGADLLVYLSVSFLLFMVLFLLRERSILWEKITKIVREMAIWEMKNEEWNIKNFSVSPHFKGGGGVENLQNKKNWGKYFWKKTDTVILEKNLQKSLSIPHSQDDLQENFSKNFYKIAIVMPVFNEWKILKNTLETLQDFQKKYKNFCIIAVDDGSQDESLKILKNFQKIFADLFVVSHSQNLGQWAALETGFEMIRRGIIDTELVATFDSDGQMDITDLPKMAEILEKNQEIDIVLGSRFLEKSPKNMPFFRKIIIKIGIIFTRMISGISLSDTHNGYRVFRKNILSKMRISLDGMGHASEILDIISREKIAFREFGVNISYTEYSLDKGQKSGNSIKIVMKMLLRKFF